MAGFGSLTDELRFVASGNMFIDIDGGDTEVYESEMAAERTGASVPAAAEQHYDNVRPILTRSPLGMGGVTSSDVGAKGQKNEGQATDKTEKKQEQLERASLKQEAAADGHGEGSPR